jgi:hypothetical protein
LAFAAGEDGDGVVIFSHANFLAPLC